jgi:hypothetical protein
MKNNGQIIRSSKNGKSNYTPISNDILQSKILTCEQKSILVHLLSLPSDWSIYKTTFWKQMNIGRDRYLKAWKGLVELGYIKENVITGKNNLIEGYSYIVYEEPVSVNPSSSQPEIDSIQNSLSVKPNIGNTEIQSTQEPVDIQSNNIEKNTSIESNNIKEIDINTSTNTGPVILGEFDIIPVLEDSKIKSYKDIIALIKSSGEKFDLSKYENYVDELLLIKENQYQSNPMLNSKETFSKLISSMHPDVEDQINILRYILQTKNYSMELVNIIWYYSQNYDVVLKKLFDQYLGSMAKLLKKDLAVINNIQFAQICLTRGIQLQEYLV